MSNNITAAGRVTTIIGVAKWLLVVAQVLTGVILLLGLNAQEDWPVWTAIAGPVALIWSLLSALLTWVLFGWFQHTLGMLVTIAANTQESERQDLSSAFIPEHHS